MCLSIECLSMAGEQIIHMSGEMNYPFKNANWPERKKELKIKGQRMPKTIKNIKPEHGSGLHYCSMDAWQPRTAPPKYCDITGHPTKYRDSVSGLYFYNKGVNMYIKMLSKPVTDQFLMLRGEIPIDKVV